MTLDGFIDIVEIGCIDPDQIGRISLRYPKDGYKVIDNNPLRSRSAQYVLAMAAYRRYVNFYDIIHDQRADGKIHSLSEKIEVIGHEETNKTYPDLYRSIITVKLKDGIRHLRDVTYPKGSPKNSMSHDMLEKKFERLTQNVLDPARAQQIGEMIAHMEDSEDIGQFTRLLATR